MHEARMDSQLPDYNRGKEHSSLVPFSRAASGACHQCGEFGHCRRECQKRVPTAAATYPLSLGDVTFSGITDGEGEGVDSQVTCSGVWRCRFTRSHAQGIYREGVDLQKGEIVAQLNWYMYLSRVDCIIALISGE